MGLAAPATRDLGPPARAASRRFLLWFAGVLSLPLVLHEAERHSVDEIVIEPGHPVTFHGEQGVLVLGDGLTEAVISDMLSTSLAPEQQAELAVAGVVEFYVEGYAEWSFVAESAIDGIVVRGRLRTGTPADAVGVPLALPPLDPFEPEASADVPTAPPSALRQTSARATRWDVNLAGSVLETLPSTHSGSLEDPSLPPRERHDGSGAAQRVPSALLEDDDIDFALVGRTPLTGEVPSPEPEPASSRSPAIGGHPTMRSDDTLAMHVDALGLGTVAYVAGVGVGERLLQHLDEGFEIIDIDTWDDVTTRPLEELPTAGRGYLVRLEDPSRCLAWLLRRLEEGARIVVETRARTAAGARRSLLGVEASPLVAAWLDAHPQLWLHTDGRAWSMARL